MRLVGYVRVSTEEQGDSGLGMEAQRASIEAHAAARPDVEIIRWYEDVISSRKPQRPGLENALMWASGPDCDGIIIAKLDRLGRSVHEVSGLLQRAVAGGWAIVSLSPMVDMTDAYGKAMAHMALVFAELERDMISQRTREALAAKKRRGEPIGPPPSVDARAEELVTLWVARGEISQRQMAVRLQERGVPTVNGGDWSRATIQRMVRRIKEKQAWTASQ